MKIVDIDHIDHAVPSTDSASMQKVYLCCCCMLIPIILLS